MKRPKAVAAGFDNRRMGQIRGRVESGLTMTRMFRIPFLSVMPASRTALHNPGMMPEPGSPEPMAVQSGT